MPTSRFRKISSGGAPPKMNDKNTDNIKQIQEFNNKAVYSKGFRFQTAIGNANTFNPVLGGTPRRLWGINIFFPNANVTDDDIISLTINSELVIDEVNWKSYNPLASGNTFKTNQFFELPRALSGSDSLKLTVNAVAAHFLYPVFYLSNA